MSRHLRRLGKTRQALTQATKSFRRYEKAAPNVQWQGDVKHGPYLPDPQNPKKMHKTYLIAFLDDHSRLVIHAEFYWAEDLVSLLDCFKKALLKYGLPARVYCDNGVIYTSRQFERICAELGIRHISARPYAPAGKGKIERFFQTLDDSFLAELKLAPVETLEALNRLFWAWLEESYHHRANRSTGQTPAARFAKGNASLRFANPEKLTLVFYWQEERRVDKTACFSFQGNRYEVAPELVGKKIEIRYDPFDLRHIKVFYQGKQYEDAVLHRLTREVDVRVTAERDKPEAPKTGISYLRLLEQQHQNRVKAALGRIRFQNLPQEKKEAKDNV